MNLGDLMPILGLIALVLFVGWLMRRFGGGTA